jgi:hypothetical protein
MKAADLKMVYQLHGLCLVALNGRMTVNHKTERT